MPRVSKKVFKKEIDKELEDNFASLISTLSSKADIVQFFQDFLTKEEQAMLTKRLMLHLMLQNQYSTSEISSFLGMSRETIRVHKNLWQRGGAIYKTILSKIASREVAKKFFKSLGKKLVPLELALKSKTDMRARAKFISADYD